MFIYLREGGWGTDERGFVFEKGEKKIKC